MNTTIALQSWCFNRFKPLPDFFKQLKSCGVSATELCGVHADFTKPETFPDVIKAFKDAGVTIVAIGVETVYGDRERDIPRFEFCKQAGVKNMSITFAPDLMDNAFAGLKNVDALAEEYDIQLGIHNHGGYDWLGNDRILKHIFNRTSPRIGLHMDTAWAIDAKMNPVKWVEDFGPRLVGVHVKDFVYSPKRQPSDVTIGTGILDLPAFVSALKARHFSGPLVIEYEGNFDAPVPALTECVQKLRALL